MLTQIEELQDERILDHIRGLGALLPSPGKRQTSSGVAVVREPLEQLRADLPLELPYRPALACGLDLVERAAVSFVTRVNTR